MVVNITPNQAQVPSPLTAEMAAQQAAREAMKKAKLKEKKKQLSKQKKDKEQQRKVESDRFPRSGVTVTRLLCFCYHKKYTIGTAHGKSGRYVHF
jgi:Ni/Co efflux regulator RcnB